MAFLKWCIELYADMQQERYIVLLDLNAYLERKVRGRSSCCRCRSSREKEAEDGGSGVRYQVLNAWRNMDMG
jgi:hypothetical protein